MGGGARNGEEGGAATVATVAIEIRIQLYRTQIQLTPVF